MSLEIKVPAVGESISEVTIGQWFKNDGDHVEMDEVICELESDKATFELTAEAAGILKTNAKEGDTLEIGDVICTIDTNASGDSAPAEKAADSPKEESSSSTGGATGEVKEMVVPTVGESITEVTLATWLKNDGDYVELDEIIAEVDSDKATFELPAEANGILRHVAQEGDTLEIGGLICKIEVTEGGAPQGEPAPAAKESASASASASANETYATGHASPAAAKILAEKGIDPKDVNGTGKDGRVTKEDAEKAQKAAKPAAKQESKPAAKTADAEAPKVSGDRNSRREKMTSLRRTISRRLVSVKNETAMLTTFNEVNMKPIMDIRKQYKDKFKEKHGVNLGFMSFFTKAVCVALQEWPAVNAQIDGNEIVYNDFCDISIAVSAPKGLVVPVIRNAEKLSFDEVEKEVVRLATKARDNKLSIDEMTGGTFTLTNGGIFGSMMSTPIINAPQSAILGMHNIVERPMAVNGEVKILPMMYLALSYDHRIIDGRESVSFLVRVKELLEDPTRLLFGV
ncbi:2-oxoglutarate dehydrogenase complex dihydrolipoyllysine-residue succinyltransferase [Litoribacter ruber]|uniref:Dihydrolipoyllysine-residue succinyltransferase component of 2-oxoglutarate dehydrogenase complex n=1 Tax=Litoribacter ruber TaxID=702568 RepID=A0AAP2CDW3_9BACT|nr:MULTISPECIES: 2-oxoglutarate dehydrogenase complex dihydrolipoyllysine-residue succinyltransferase [Litoribacter]MBS9522433.1 2-oxoglutarate dehydrogenase complex dihydrolipoyllysine-residue succinyltransferase [Litoribacter alkaliphilus]MBT0810953.1 2-oxoglutarate dehydrogenase complex dihydrolipoyllysine-residue succinyltransferase [Litoribacter ruber]